MIEIKDLSFSYDNKVEVLDNVSLEIADGSWVSILGHNGSGKSTLAKLLVGILEKTEGFISVDGEELTEESINSIRSKIGIVFQNPDNQFVGVTVLNDIAFGLENRCVERKEMLERIYSSAHAVSLDDYLDREPHKLSGGEKQRVAVAGIIALDLKYIIFDEATSMLDPKGVKDVKEIIRKLKEQGHTIITITHDLDFASKSDYVCVLKNGKVIASGSPSEVISKEDVLYDSNLIAPFNLRLYHKVLEDKNLNKDERLVNLLCKLNSTK